MEELSSVTTMQAARPIVRPQRPLPPSPSEQQAAWRRDWVAAVTSCRHGEKAVSCGCLSGSAANRPETAGAPACPRLAAAAHARLTPSIEEPQQVPAATESDDHRLLDVAAEVAGLSSFKLDNVEAWLTNPANAEERDDTQATPCAAVLLRGGLLLLGCPKFEYY